MTNPTQVYLKELCEQCSGKVFRITSHDKKNAANSSVGHLHTTQVTDKCQDCDHIVRQTEVIPWPCLKLDDLAQQWLAGKLDRKPLTKK